MAARLPTPVTWPHAPLKQYLVSRSLKSSPGENVELVSGDPVALVRRLKQETGKDVWLCGGGDLATTVFPEIDELILKVNPVLLGAGIPLFSGAIKQTGLKLAESKVYDNGFVLLRYRLRH